MNQINGNKHRSYYGKMNIVDIMCTSFVTLFLIVCCVIMTGCGKTDVVTDYGYHQDTEIDEAGKVRAGGSDDNNDNADESQSFIGGSSLIEMIGTQNIEWSEELNASGIPVEVSLKYTVPDVESINVYVARLVNDGKDDEEEIVKKFFGGTGEKVDKIITDTDDMYLQHYEGYYTNDDNDRVDYSYDLSGAYAKAYEYLGAAFSPDESEDDVYVRNENIEPEQKWLDTDRFYIHIWQGKHEEVEFRLIYGYSYEGGAQYIGVEPVHPDTYFPGKELSHCFLYSSDDDVNQNDKEFNDDMALDSCENQCSMSEQEVVENTKDFLEDYFNVVPYSELGKFNNKDESDKMKYQCAFYGDEFAAKLDEWSLNNNTDYDNIRQVAEKEVYMDGYCVYFDSALSGIDSNLGTEGFAYVTSRGINRLSLRRSCDITDVTENVRIIDFEKIKACFRDVVENQLDMEMLKEKKKLYFTKVRFDYYAIDNPEDDRECTFIPVWTFETRNDNVLIGGWTQIIVNALDGSLVNVVY